MHPITGPPNNIFRSCGLFETNPSLCDLWLLEKAEKRRFDEEDCENGGLYS
jgi:hypothetical protein